MTKPRSYEPIAWRDGSVRFLDQVLLPHATTYTETRQYEDVVAAIQRLSIRGAPLLGIAGAYAVVLASVQAGTDQRMFEDAAEVIAGARPTAVNLRYAVDRLLRSVASRGQTPEERTSALLKEALAIHDEVLKADDTLSRNGADLFSSTVSILTICNTGPLATGGNGTAFGIIHELWKRGRLERAFACETRPLLQGARLTMWEFRQAGIPATLLHDSAAGALIREGSVDAVIVGADRIAANGDTANKIGTFVLSVLADRAGIPFYVAAPTSTIDPSTPDGSRIPIEERGGDEVRTIAGNTVADEYGNTYSPAFDVTPAELITSIVTDSGVFQRPYDLRAIVAPGGTR